MDEVLFSSEISDVQKMATKLHKQFGHPTAAKLISLVKRAGICDIDLENKINEISQKCEVCLKYRKPSARPVVSLPLASVFNETVAMDLKVWGNIHFLVMVDLATRFCTATVVNDKKATTIIRSFFSSWICIFGAPRRILSDNGGEFSNAEMRDLGEAFNIEILCTAAESPWSNGVCERLNAVIGNSVSRIMSDSSCDVYTALAWAVSARNALCNNHGYSPNQLVFGSNPVYPNVFNNEIPAQEPRLVSRLVADNLNAMHRARDDFIRIESSERIKRAMSHNVRPSQLEDLQCGDSVYYKRNDSHAWRGPGKVIGKDGKQVLVKHGGIYVRVHVCRLRRDAQQENATGEINTDKIENVSNKVQSETVEHKINSYTYVDDSCSDVESVRDVSGAVDEACVPVSEQQNISNDKNSTISRSIVGRRIKGIHADTGEWITAKVLSRAGKATGRYKNCYNIEKDSDGTIIWMDLEKDFTEWKAVDDDTEVLIMSNNDSVMVAKEVEMKNWIDNDVFIEVEDSGQFTISARWVVTEKIKNGERIVKARLVARGFEEDIGSLRTDSPTCSKEAIKLSFAIISSKGWTCHSIDVKAAFLQGNNIERDVFLRPPPEYNNGMIWKLRKTVYGLNDAARAWYLRVRSELLAIDVKVCSLDPALFYWNHEDQFHGIMCLHVDDFFWAGTHLFEKQIIKKIRNLFLIGSSDCNKFKYVGVSIEPWANGLSVNQFSYASSIVPCEISCERARSKLHDLSDREKSSYRAIVGQLNWMSTQTRPDIAFDVCDLSVALPQACVGDLLRLNKVIKRVTADHVRLFFPRLDIQNCWFECYSDASFGNLAGGASQGAHIVFLTDNTSRKCPIAWQSRKIRRVVKSTLAAECLALLDCADTAVFLSHMFAEVACVKQQILKVKCCVDNKSLVEALYSTKSVEDHRLRIDIAVLKDMLRRGELTQVSWVSTVHQLANCMTKRGAPAGQLIAAISGH